MFTALLTSFVLVVLSFITHYTGLRYLAGQLDRKTHHPNSRFVIVMLAIFMLHILEVMQYATGYWAGEHVLGFGHMHGDREGSWLDAIYASAVIYSSLGFGDIVPLDNMRVLASLEVIAGLMLIGWSTSFSFLLMQRLWQHHGSKH